MCYTFLFLKNEHAFKWEKVINISTIIANVCWIIAN